ncbi:nucleolar complex-associated protein 3-like isoform X1 [Rhodamnia argentea]|uniref:Nucleolar complex-associated protein 3-like isoform X1 n=1 Tax=Rhodamnia argentea TaxID=178133 RepID=A0A8B8R3E1_9MYRT|nr:nucleolar complex-associated protein 3-like isoform X1 [Rhodamnia argentea]
MGKQKIILPPDLPPEVSEEEIQVSDEDLQFVNDNLDYAGFVSRLDTHSITKHVTRVADLKEDALEALYEKRLKKKKALQKDEEEEEEQPGIRVGHVDTLPVKTLDGQLYYRTLLNASKPSEGEGEGEERTNETDKGVVKLTKAERRAKLKKSKKEAKKQTKELPQDEVKDNPQRAVLAELKEDVTAEESFETKKCKLAELGIALLADPESNIKLLKEMLQMCNDGNHAIVKLGLLSLLSVFKDIIPGYRIRLPTEKELEMKVSKDVKKMRYYESTLLSAYKAYLQKLMVLEKVSLYQHAVVRCICTLLDAVPHFNYRESLVEVVVRNISSSDEVIRKLCCDTIKSLFTNEGKHGGEVTGAAVRLIANYVKAHNCQMHPDSIQVLMSLSFDEDLGRSEAPDKDKKVRNKKYKKGNRSEESSHLQPTDRKKSRQEMMSKMRDEVAADYKAASFTPDIMERRRMQSETLSAVFEIYFRVLKHTMQSIVPRPSGDTGTTHVTEAHPLLGPCLDGLAKFSHLMDLDYMGDLMDYLKKLACSGGKTDSSGKCLTVSERLRCCIIAFKVMRNNLDALNVDLQDFFVQLYNLILEYRPGRDQGEVLAEALKMMLCNDRQHDMQKAAAFIKRLATFSLCFESAESMAALVTLKHLLLKNVKCRVLLENDPGGGSVSGSVAKYQPYASDPNQSGALASVLWELNLLTKHYHPTISTLASGISNMSAAPTQAYLSTLTPQQAFRDLSLERESFSLKSNAAKSSNKRKRGSEGVTASSVDRVLEKAGSLDEDEVKKKLSEHYTLLRGVKENERLRSELDRTTRALSLYDDYKKQKKQKRRRKNHVS